MATRPDDPPLSAAAPPEPPEAQGEYNPQAPEEPLRVPSVPPAPQERRVELLAPAGSLDAGFAAYQNGADAVYLGLQKFSARADADNFTIDELDELTAFAHSLTPRRRVLVALNTVVLQKEIGELLELLEACADRGADAVLVQDLGVYHLIRRHFPELELHGSTQLAVHNVAGARALRDLGFKRVVLSRELTFEEIREIAALPDIETEVFIHGSLCYAYSGLCLLSAQTLSRSGNRGRCAYACRDSFQVTGAPRTLRDGSTTKRDPGRGFPFSMKDLALADFLPGLVGAGVACFKIEGRKKNPLYVAATTRYYRDLLDGRLPTEERPAREAELQTIFSRPWTRLFVQSHRDKEVADRDTVGHRGARIGEVLEVVSDDSGDWLRFVTSRRLEVHDGIQVDLSRLRQPFGCAIDEMRVAERGRPGRTVDSETDGGRGPDYAGLRRASCPRSQDARGPDRRPVFEVPAGSTVEVLLPEDHPDLPPGAPVYCSSSQEVKQRYRLTRPKPGLYRTRLAATFHVTIDRNELRVRATAQSPRSGASACEVVRCQTGPFEPAKDAARQEAAVRTAFGKLGDTYFTQNAFEYSNPEGLFVPVSVLNQVRRDITTDLDRELKKERNAFLQRLRAEYPSLATGAQTSSASAPLRWSIKVDRLSFVDHFESSDWEGVDEVVVDIARDHGGTLPDTLKALGERLGREHIRLALPAITRKWEEGDIRRKVERLRADGWCKWEAANVSAWGVLGAPAELDWATDWSLYCVNRVAARQFFSMGATRVCLSPEDGIANVRSMLAEFRDRATLIVYQDTPQFIAESCAYANLIGGCPGKANCLFEEMDLKSSYDEKLKAIDYHCRTILITQEAFCLASFIGELRKAGAVSLRADFIYRRYEPGQVRDIWRLLRAGRTVTKTYSARFEQGLL